MSGNPGFLIGEKDGVELAYSQEYTPESVDILYEIGSSITVKDKLDALVTSYGFGIKFIDENETFTIPENKAHITAGLLTNCGLINNCELLVIL